MSLDIEVQIHSPLRETVIEARVRDLWVRLLPRAERPVVSRNDAQRYTVRSGPGGAELLGFRVGDDPALWVSVSPLSRDPESLLVVGLSAVAVAGEVHDEGNVLGCGENPDVECLEGRLGTHGDPWTHARNLFGSLWKP